ncbi:hypothetical protein BOTBODRAFT_430229 [Botryobasidium botryosum FD-172 SS1]|uniref:Protein kinase domain-containing protein n=1 Tax=Botryobasidium botryosum (strain FD-172 SS1) TaxID=930990 RepID=A0A067M8E8_BOTB1|nr:hypothetical protein BOTBODRAFT_430229 [Botryobasidium botryosum FD-172 SS1]
MLSPNLAKLDITEKVRVVSKLPVARGGYSDIYQGYYRATQTTNLVVAIKVITVRGALDEEDEKKVWRRLNREIIVCKDLNHPHVTKFWGFCYPFDFELFPALVSPWYRNGTARAYLLAHPKADRLVLFKEVTSALYYLHSLKPPIVHGDLKSDNILVDNKGHACLSDFGLSRIFQFVKTGLTTTTAAGSYRWMAPELLFPENDKPAMVTKESDMYALGCLGIEIFTDQRPWDPLSDPQVLIRVYHGETPPRPKPTSVLSDFIWSMLRPCWRPNPFDRPRVEHFYISLCIRAGVWAWQSRHSNAMKHVVQPPKTFGFRVWIT